jgi:hypothetical protein
MIKFSSTYKERNSGNGIDAGANGVSAMGVEGSVRGAKGADSDLDDEDVEKDLDLDSDKDAAAVSVLETNNKYADGATFKGSFIEKLKDYDTTCTAKEQALVVQLGVQMHNVCAPACFNRGTYYECPKEHGSEGNINRIKV